MFVFAASQLGLVNLFAMAPGLKGLVMSNAALELPNVFDAALLRGADYILTLHPSH